MRGRCIRREILDVAVRQLACIVRHAAIIRCSRAASSASVMSLSRFVIASAERCRSRDCAGQKRRRGGIARRAGILGFGRAPPRCRSPNQKTCGPRPPRFTIRLGYHLFRLHSGIGPTYFSPLGMSLTRCRLRAAIRSLARRMLSRLNTRRFCCLYPLTLRSMLSDQVLLRLIAEKRFPKQGRDKDHRGRTAAAHGSRCRSRLRGLAE